MGREVQYTSEAGASRLIHMAIGDVLYTRIAMQERSVFRGNMEKMRKEIGKKRQFWQQVLEIRVQPDGRRYDGCVEP